MTLNLTLQILDAWEKLPPEEQRKALALARKLAAAADKTEAQALLQAAAAKRKPATKKK